MNRIQIAIATFVVVALMAPAQAQGIFGLKKFKVEQSDDRFATDGNTTFSGLNNRVSKKSVAGGIHIDSKGMFVEPVVMKRKADNAVVALSLFVHNETDHDTSFGAPNSIGRPQRISFLTGEGQPIALTISDSNRKWSDVVSYNSATRSASTSVSESGFAELSPEEFRRIAYAPALAVKIDGSERSIVYEVKDISKAFTANLRTFYSTYVAPASS